jgi:hypothetical protein
VREEKNCRREKLWDTEKSAQGARIEEQLGQRHVHILFIKQEDRLRVKGETKRTRTLENGQIMNISMASVVAFVNTKLIFLL